MEKINVTKKGSQPTGLGRDLVERPSQETGDVSMSAYEIAKAARDALQAEIDGFGATLKAFPKGPMNLTTDAARATPRYRVARDGYNNAFAALRNFNAYFVKAFRLEIATEHAAKYSTKN
jgi:hypothetical protein